MVLFHTKRWFFNAGFMTFCSIFMLIVSCSDSNSIGEESNVFDNGILGLTFDGVEMELPIEIDHEKRTVNAYMLGSVEITNLVPRFELSPNTKVSPKDGVPYNFTKGMTFQIVASDKTFENYIVSVHQIKNEILSFKLVTQQEAWNFAVRNGNITKEGKGEYAISISIHADDDITTLSSIVELSEGATISPAIEEVTDYSNPVEFVVSDVDGNTHKYLATVNQHSAQTIDWNEANEYADTEGIQMYTTNSSFRFNEDGTPMPFSAYAVKIDMSKGFKFVPSYDKSLGKMTVERMVEEYKSEHGVIPKVGINAGYFGGDSSYSLIVKESKLLANNIPQLTRDGSFYVTRGAFGHDASLNFSTDWVYTINPDQVYGYPNPALNVDGETPKPKPTPSFPEGGAPYDKTNAIGGGPVLIKDGQLIENYQYELFYDDIIRSIANRTAIGITANNELILLVVDGRASYSSGIAMKDMAKILKNDFNCIDALNLDGGGSSTLIVNGEVYNQNSIDSGQRNVLTGLLIVKE